MSNNRFSRIVLLICSKQQESCVYYELKLSVAIEKHQGFAVRVLLSHADLKEKHSEELLYDAAKVNLAKC